MSNHGVSDPRRDAVAESCLAQQPHEGEERRSFHFEECEEGVPEDVLHTWTKKLAPYLLEGCNDAGRRLRPPVWIGTAQNVERKREGCVAGVEQDHVVGAMRGNGGENRLAKVAMRIDKADAAAGGDVGSDQPMEER